MSEEASKAMKPVLITFAVIIILISGSGLTYFMTPLNEEEIRIRKSILLDNNNNNYVDTIILTVENQGFMKATIKNLTVSDNKQNLHWIDNSTSVIPYNHQVIIICEAFNESEELQYLDYIEIKILYNWKELSLFLLISPEFSNLPIIYGENLNDKP